MLASVQQRASLRGQRARRQRVADALGVDVLGRHVRHNRPPSSSAVARRVR
jgi:hypothetical protein